MDILSNSFPVNKDNFFCGVCAEPVEYHHREIKNKLSASTVDKLICKEEQGSNNTKK